MKTLTTELSSLNSRLNTVTAQLNTLNVPIDCKWVGKQAGYTAQAKSLVVDCPSTHPVLVSGGGRCQYQPPTNPMCDVTGQKAAYSGPSWSSSSGTYLNSWALDCEKPAKTGCPLPQVYAFCCKKLTTNLPGDIPTTP